MAEPRFSGKTAKTVTKATRTIGMFRRKMDPNQKRSRRAPPMVGPATMPSPSVADHAPSALARSRASGKRKRTEARVQGSRAAAPMPVRARATMREPAEGE